MRSIEYFHFTVPSLSALPPAMRAAIEQHQPAQEIRGIIVIPPQEYPDTRLKLLAHLPFRWQKTPRRTLVFGERQITILSAEQSGGLATTVIPIDAIVSIDLAVVLLYAYLRLAWLTGGGLYTQKIEFNAVGERAIRNQVNLLRAGGRSEPEQRAPSGALEEVLAPLPLKFRNYMRLALLTGEDLAAVVYQPAVRRGKGWLRPYIAPNRAVGLTACDVVIVEEQLRAYTKYGMVTRYFSTAHLQRVSFDSYDDMPEIVWMQLSSGTDQASQPVRILLTTAGAVAFYGACRTALGVPVTWTEHRAAEPDQTAEQEPAEEVVGSR
jgi:hypothetical protein